jgi:hypothetical protein
MKMVFTPILHVSYRQFFMCLIASSGVLFELYRSGAFLVFPYLDSVLVPSARDFLHRFLLTEVP